MSVRLQILAQFKGSTDSMQQLCGRPVKTTGDWVWAITDPLHRPFLSNDLTALPSVSLRIALDDGDWIMEVYSGGSRILSIRDREEDAVAMAKAIGRSGIPVSSEEELADALGHKNITTGEKRWPVGTLPRVLELLYLNEIFPNWREEAKKEEIPIEVPPTAEAVARFDPNALYNGRSGWFREIKDRKIPEGIAQAAAQNDFTQPGIFTCSKWEDLCFAVFRHSQESIYVVYELEFQLTIELFSFPGDKIVVTCNHAYPVNSKDVIAQMLPRKPLSELVLRHIEKLKTLPEPAPAGTLYDFCILYDRYISG